MRRFWYFDVSLWSVDKKSCLSKLSNKCVFTPYCKDWEPIPPKTHLWASDFHEFNSASPRHPPNIPLITPRHLCGTFFLFIDNNIATQGVGNHAKTIELIGIQIISFLWKSYSWFCSGLRTQRHRGWSRWWRWWRWTCRRRRWRGHDGAELWTK